MTPEEFLASLRARGFSATYDSTIDKLLITPRKQMTDDDIAYVLQHRAELVSLVSQSLTGYLRRRLVAQMVAEYEVTETEASQVVSDLEFTSDEARAWLFGSSKPYWDPPDCTSNTVWGCDMVLWCQTCSPVSAFDSYLDAVRTHLLVMGWSGWFVRRITETMSEENARTWILSNYCGQLNPLTNQPEPLTNQPEPLTNQPEPLTNQPEPVLAPATIQGALF